MPDDRQDTIDQIIKDRDAAHDQLATTEASLQRKINDVDDIEWTRPLTADERDNRKRLRDAQTATRSAMVELSFVTLQAMDQSSEVQRLVNAFQSINAELKSATDRVNKIANIAATTEKVISAIAQIAAQLAKFAA